MAEKVGLKPDEVAQALEGNDYAEEVRADEEEAMNLGVNGVPFYVFDRKFAVSGAQPTNVFRSALEKAWQEELSE